MRALIVGNGIVGKATELAMRNFGWECEFYDVLPERRTVMMSYARVADAVLLCVHAGGHVSKDSAIAVEVARDVAQYVPACVVQRTTCMPGTADKAAEVSGLAERYCVWPEFLREATWGDDALHPSRVVLGEDLHAIKLYSQFFAFVHAASRSSTLYVTSRKNAEVIKLVANAMLALRISAWNSLAGLLGEDAEYVKLAVVRDPRLRSFDVTFGRPYAGKCLPKDLDALLDYCKQQGTESEVLDACRSVNRRMGGA
jgi:UDP-glucose 6-dehydrogenase